jgi:hypothetical protein
MKKIAKNSFPNPEIGDQGRFEEDEASALVAGRLQAYPPPLVII